MASNHISCHEELISKRNTHFRQNPVDCRWRKRYDTHGLVGHNNARRAMAGVVVFYWEGCFGEVEEEIGGIL